MSDTTIDNICIMTNCLHLTPSISLGYEMLGLGNYVNEKEKCNFGFKHKTSKI